MLFENYLGTWDRYTTFKKLCWRYWKAFREMNLNLSMTNICLRFNRKIFIDSWRVSYETIGTTLGMRLILDQLSCVHTATLAALDLIVGG